MGNRFAELAGTLLAACCLTGVLCGCDSVVRHYGQTGGAGMPRGHGLYVATLHTLETGSVATVVAADSTPDGCRFNSRPDATWALIGGVKGLLASMFEPDKFRGGTLLRGEIHTQGTDGKSTGKVSTILGEYAIESVNGQPNRYIFQNDRGERLGVVEFEPTRPDEGPRSDYANLARQISDTIHNHLFDDDAARRPATRRYCERLRKLADVAYDDAEYMLGAFIAADKLPYSLTYLHRQLANDAPDVRQLTGIKPFEVWRDGRIAVLKPRRYASWDALDQGLKMALDPRPDGLILDLRWNTGGSFGLLHVADTVLDAPGTIGVLFSRQARKNAQRRKWDDFPRRSQFDSAQALVDDIHKSGAIVAEVKPVAEAYDGAMAVLIGAQTAGACEVIAELLQRRHRATLVGEQTAGAGLFTETFDLGQGWRLELPTFDYLTADRRRLEGSGVEPDVVTSVDGAYERAKELLTD